MRKTIPSFQNRYKPSHTQRPSIPLTHDNINININNKLTSLPPQNSQYKFMQILGHGAFSQVYLAMNKFNNSECVIKVYEKKSISTRERKNNLRKQLEALSIQKHVNLVTLIDHYEDEKSIAIVMEFFSKNSLAEFSKKNRPIDNETLRKIAGQICEGLKHLHSFGIAHRDIKPENVLINANLEVKIIDFGFATTEDESHVVVAGTPIYMAPELMAKKNYDPTVADIWALGIMLYWLGTGFFPPFPRTTLKTMSKKQIKSDRQLQFPVDINPGFEYLVRKMLTEKPKERISLSEILENTWLKPKCLKNEIQKLRQSQKIATLIQFY